MALVLDFTRKQIDPEALRIIERTGHKVSPGRRNPDQRDFSPNWDGLSTQWWIDLRANNPKDFIRLIHICEEDFPTFCAVLLRVYNKTVSRIHPFIFNKAQQYSWNIFANMLGEGLALFIVFLKARQLGVSTLVLATHEWHVWRERDVNTTVIAHKDKLAQTLVATLSLFYDELPDLIEIKPKLRANNRTARVPKKELYFSMKNGLEWRAQISTMVSKNFEARGERTKHILESEYAFYDDPQALNDALMPQLPPIGSPARKECSVIVESTPNGQNHFYDFWRVAKSGDTEWKAIFLPWFIADDLYSVEPPADWNMSRDEKRIQKELSKERVNKYDGLQVTKAQMYWRNCEIKSKAGDHEDSEMAFNMEYPSDDESCFLLYESKSIFRNDMRYLGSCIFEMEEIGRQTCRDNGWPKGDYGIGNLEFEQLGNPFYQTTAPTFKRPIFVPKRNGNLKVWEAPTPGHLYTSGSDPGDTQDNAITSIICVTCARQAATLCMHGEGIENFCDHTIALNRWYFRALWMPEVNEIGSTLLKRAMNLWHYGNIAREEKFDEMGLKKNKYGWMTSEHNKPILISPLQSLIREQYFMIADRELRSELSTFEAIDITSRGNQRMKGRGSAHDDRVMSIALALKAVDQSPKYLAEMTRKRHNLIPSAFDLGINAAPQSEERLHNSLPEAIAEHLGDNMAYDLSMNPIRGVFGGLF